MTAILFAKYLKWHFIDATLELIQVWRNILWFNFNYFSVSLLAQTFFSPWHKISWGYERGFSIGSYLFTFFSNIISRILGAIMRSFLIVAGITVQIILFLLAIITVIFWIALPAITTSALLYGIFLLV